MEYPNYGRLGIGFDDSTRCHFARRILRVNKMDISLYSTDSYRIYIYHLLYFQFLYLFWTILFVIRLLRGTTASASEHRRNFIVAPVSFFFSNFMGFSKRKQFSMDFFALLDEFLFSFVVSAAHDIFLNGDTETWLPFESSQSIHSNDIIAIMFVGHSLLIHALKLMIFCDLSIVGDIWVNG